MPELSPVPPLSPAAAPIFAGRIKISVPTASSLGGYVYLKDNYSICQTTNDITKALTVRFTPTGCTPCRFVLLVSQSLPVEIDMSTSFDDCPA